MAKLRLIRSTWLAEDIVRLDFADPGSAELPRWAPGAHLTLHLAGGVSREYSLCGDPANRVRYTVCVQREAASRGGSAHVHDRLRVGEIVDVDGPRNNFALEDAPSYVLIAGGIGITPLRAMARELAARGADWKMLYCGRSRTRMAFAGELGAHGCVTVHADDQDGGPADLTAFLAAAPADALVYCCGPGPLLDAVSGLLPDASRLRVERFRPPSAAAAPVPQAGFDVVCSAGRFAVRPGTSILRTLLDAGLDIPFSCQEGICGTCETRVVRGQPDHRDYLLSDQEKEAGKTMLLCVSRSHTPELVLDL
jgi:tetrachlorobenzoquinone reductase